ncbi:hypothetical protein AAW12_08660 [Sphingobacterium sp. Ag1]|uniref:hypothetical protein n=1 Tax=Sphingobacterium sp. Ag1 TaxID=1643451 RepID=UPI000627D281|nr:hypothetical protein [Sphingobacterium sp. Ag1]KKO91723.1 hypothetical protein AAW12_08660 [Sphingobacterium sp. Ag1]
MTEFELYNKLQEMSKLLDDYQKGKIEKSKHDWGKEILKESQEILRKSHVVGAMGTPCPCCQGSGRS